MRTLTLSLILSAAVAGLAAAHPATEQFIPIGQSPGAVTMQGEVTAAPASTATETSFSMNAPGVSGDVAYLITPSTRIYVDNSARGQPSTIGSTADLQPGRSIEVCVPDTATRIATWIKVRDSE